MSIGFVSIALICDMSGVHSSQLGRFHSTLNIVFTRLHNDKSAQLTYSDQNRFWHFNAILYREQW